MEYAMPPTALPWIEEPDFPRFQRLIAELRHMSFEEWADDHRRAAAYRVPRTGSTNIPVRPDEFEAWLKQTRQVAHMELLWTFAEEIAEQPGVRKAS
jgi:hypothetical protein